MSVEAELRASLYFIYLVSCGSSSCHILIGILLHEPVGSTVLGRGSLQVNLLIFSEQQQISSKGGWFFQSSCSVTDASGVLHSGT